MVKWPYEFRYRQGIRVINKGIRLLAVAITSVAFSFAAVAEEEDEKPESITAEQVTLEDGSKTQKGAKPEDGKWLLPEGEPTYNVLIKDNKLTVDWYTYNGYRRYHDACHVCHGPDGAGSTYAPALADSLKTMSYDDVIGVIASGRVATLPDGSKSVMPEFGSNKNVMCYIDDIYAYLKARASGSLPRLKLGGRNRAPKPDTARKNDKECFGEG